MIHDSCGGKKTKIMLLTLARGDVSLSFRLDSFNGKEFNGGLFFLSIKSFESI